VNADINQSLFRGALFDKCKFTNTTVLKTNLFESSFRGAQVSKSDFVASNLYQADFQHAVLEQTRLETCDLGRTILEKE
jgi:uncharacterized protein YjbI with pentapeptide repeats